MFGAIDVVREQVEAFNSTTSSVSWPPTVTMPS